MLRSRQGLSLTVALIGLAAFATSADAAKTKRYHPARTPHATTSRDFPIYVSRGVDRNPGGDNLYFQDTKRPSYLVGPGFLGYINNNTTFGPNY
jgi:hypothetical protein